jgi:hypothetical protein
VSLTQRSNATLNATIPASAARLAVSSPTPRPRSTSAMVDASLISSRSRSSALASMTAWR